MALAVTDEQMSRYLGLADEDAEALELAARTPLQRRPAAAAGAGSGSGSGTAALALSAPVGVASSSSPAPAAASLQLQLQHQAGAFSSLLFQPNPITLYEIKSARRDLLLLYCTVYHWSKYSYAQPYSTCSSSALGVLPSAEDLLFWLNCARLQQFSISSAEVLTDRPEIQCTRTVL